MSRRGLFPSIEVAGGEMFRVTLKKFGYLSRAPVENEWTSWMESASGRRVKRARYFT